MIAKPQPPIGVDRIARLQAVLSKPLPKGGPLKRLMLAAVAKAPTEKKSGACAWTIERLAAVAGTRPDRASSALRQLRNAGFLKLKRCSGRIVEIWLPAQTGEPRDVIERRKARQQALSPEFAANVTATVRWTAKCGGIRLNHRMVISWAVSLRAGRNMKRTVLAAELGMQLSQCRLLVPAETWRDARGKSRGVTIRPTENRRDENPKIIAPEIGGSTRGRAHSSRTTGTVCGEIAMKQREGKGSTLAGSFSATQPALRIVAGSDMTGQGRVMTATAVSRPTTDAAQLADSPPPWEPEPSQWEIDDGSPFLHAGTTRAATRRGAA